MDVVRTIQKLAADKQTLTPAMAIIRIKRIV
jgi:hypothetical protein